MKEKWEKIAARSYTYVHHNETRCEPTVFEDKPSRTAVILYTYYTDDRIAPSKLLQQDKSDFTEKRACDGTIY